jgi:CRP-like cAMP-binding protein
VANPLIARLERFVALDAADHSVLAGLVQNVRDVAGGDLIREGDRPDAVLLLMDGWACRYKLLPDGKRQITAFLIPGDLCDVHIFVLAQMDHSIGLLCPARVAFIAPQLMLDAMAQRPTLARALWWGTLVDEAVLRAWLVNLGRREPFERVAHLLCELWLRASNVGLVTRADRFDLPITQAELADALGLTTATVNRTLQRLRTEKLITLEGGRLTVLDVPHLIRASGFEASYLHGEPTGQGAWIGSAEQAS